MMLIAFFDVKGVVHMDFLPQGQTIISKAFTTFNAINLRKKAPGFAIMTMLLHTMP